MTDDAYDYRETFDHVLAICRTFAMQSLMLPEAAIDEALAAVDRADSVGFILDPTMYRDALADRRLDKQRAILRAFREFRAALKAAEAIGAKA